MIFGQETALPILQISTLNFQSQLILTQKFQILVVEMVNFNIIGACLEYQDNYKIILEKNLQIVGIDIDYDYVQDCK